MLKCFKFLSVMKCHQMALFNLGNYLGKFRTIYVPLILSCWMFPIDGQTSQPRKLKLSIFEIANLEINSAPW